MAAMGTVYFEAAKDALPLRSRGVMVAAEMMRASYQRVLEKIRDGGYRVLEKRFRVPDVGCGFFMRFAAMWTTWLMNLE